VLLPSLLLLGACQDRPTDADLYQQVLTAPAAELGQDQARCGRIDDLDLRGDCVVTLATRRRDADGPPSPELLCATAPVGTWRDECLFVSAEAARKRGQRERAAELCREAGGFKDDCGQHLWQGEVRSAIAPSRRGAPQPTYAEALPVAREIYLRWAPLLEDDTDMSERFWRRFYQNGFERHERLDLSACEGLPDDHETRCQQAAVLLMLTRLDTDLRSSGIDPCTLRQGVGPAAAALRVVPHPALDEALHQWQTERCTEPAAGAGGRGSTEPAAGAGGRGSTEAAAEQGGHE